MKDVTLNLNLPYLVKQIDREAQAAFRSNAGITEVVIRNAVIAKYPNGIQSPETLDIYSDVQDLLTDAVETKKNEIVLTVAQIRFVGSCLKDYSTAVQVAPWARKLRDEVNSIILQLDVKKKEVELPPAPAPRSLPATPLPLPAPSTATG